MSERWLEEVFGFGLISRLFGEAMGDVTMLLLIGCRGDADDGRLVLPPLAGGGDVIAFEAISSSGVGGFCFCTGD